MRDELWDKKLRVYEEIIYIPMSRRTGWLLPDLAMMLAQEL
ncbi:MAG: hypothetical protein ACLTSZ_13280 [Lachnospiraceae bacterium]